MKKLIVFIILIFIPMSAFAQLGNRNLWVTVTDTTNVRKTLQDQYYYDSKFWIGNGTYLLQVIIGGGDATFVNLTVDTLNFNELYGKTFHSSALEGQACLVTGDDSWMGISGGPCIGFDSTNPRNIQIQDADLILGSSTVYLDNASHAFIIHSDADADVGASTESFYEVRIVPNADPALAYYGITTTGSIWGIKFIDSNVGIETGYKFYTGTLSWTMASTDSIDGEVIGADTIDDDALDFTDITLADFTADEVRLTEGLTVNETYSGVTAVVMAGEDIFFHHTVTKKSDGKYYLTDADAVTTMPAMGIALSPGTDLNTMLILLKGYICDTDWDWSVGNGQANLLFPDDASAGEIVQFAGKPSDAGDQIQVIGRVISADCIYFNPDYTIVEI